MSWCLGDEGWIQSPVLTDLMNCSIAMNSGFWLTLESICVIFSMTSKDLITSTCVHVIAKLPQSCVVTTCVSIALLTCLPSRICLTVAGPYKSVSVQEKSSPLVSIYRHRRYVAGLLKCAVRQGEITGDSCHFLPCGAALR